MKCKLIKTIPINNILGEGVIWDDITKKIWWTDIESKRLFSYGFFSKEVQSHDLPERLCSFAMIENSSSFLAAFETGLAIFNPLDKSVQWIEEIFKKGCGIRLNDGRVDRFGQFWVGAMVEAKSPNNVTSIAAELFCYSSITGLSIQETNILISNSLCWSPEGMTFYFADSVKNTIYTYDVSKEDCRIKNKRIFVRTAPSVHPDGSCVDSEGCLWNAQWGGGQVIRYTPDGQIDYVLEIPCPQPTCVSFAGPNLDHLVVTSASLGVTIEDKLKYPQCGSLFIFKTNFKGLREKRFKLKP